MVWCQGRTRTLARSRLGAVYEDEKRIYAEYMAALAAQASSEH
jgi:hypothetical protein